MPKVVYNILENTREDINVTIYKEKNIVVKERLLELRQEMEINQSLILLIMLLGTKLKKAKEYCEENNITLFFLSLHSPKYNPIERVWGFLKSKVKID